MDVSFGFSGDTKGFERLTFSGKETNVHDNCIVKFIL